VTSNLTIQECDQLIEAVDVWIADPLQSEINRVLVESMLVRSPAERDAAIARANKLEGFTNSRTHKLRKEAGTLLKAKLIQLKQSIAADQILDEARNAGGPR
jgi:hypothetical protein